MKKQISLFIIIVFILFSLNSQTKKMAITDFYITYNDVEVRLGESLIKLDSDCINKEYKILKNNSYRYKVFDYSWGQVYTFEKSKDYKICGFVINSDEVFIIDKIRLGSEKQIVLEKRGIPFYQDDNSVFYYNDDFDVLELKISFDKNNIVSKIQLFMGT